jgi:hypothetical protein
MLAWKSLSTSWAYPCVASVPPQFLFSALRERERAENKNPGLGGGDTCKARVGPTSLYL